MRSETLQSAGKYIFIDCPQVIHGTLGPLLKVCNFEQVSLSAESRKPKAGVPEQQYTTTRHRRLKMSGDPPMKMRHFSRIGMRARLC
jgi:hypothetical protein